VRILVVDEDNDRTAALADILRNAGHTVMGTLTINDNLRQAVDSLNPDLVIVNIESPYRDYLESLVTISQERPRPVAMFVSRDDENLSAKALDTGVMVYAVDGVSPKLVQSVLQVAIAQFERFAKLDAELKKSKAALAERKAVERAKGLLMAHQGLSEEEAYKALRQMAMNQGRKLSDVAETVLGLAYLLKIQAKK